jgi:hypothetical protein
MAIFAIMAPSENQLLISELQRLFPGDHLKVGPGQWLLSAPRTAKEISDSLGISDGKTGTALVVSVGAYFGRAQADIWDWMNARMQRVP